MRLAEPFALSAGEVRQRVDELLESVGGVPGRYSVHLAGAHEDAALLSLQLAGDVFLEAFDNTPDTLRREYAHLLPSMAHVVVIDRETRTAAGCLVLQEGAAAELKTVVDLAGEPWSLPPERSLAVLGLAPGDTNAGDLLILAVAPEHRKQGVGLLLLYAGWVVSVAKGIDRWTAILDDALVDGLDEVAEGELAPIAASRPYLGSPASTPVTLRMRPSEDVGLLRMMQGVGDAFSATAAFCPRLEEARRTFQAWA